MTDVAKDIKLLHEKAKALMRAKTSEPEIASELMKHGITADYADLIIRNVAEDIVKRKAFWKNLIAGICVCTLTIFLNYLSYQNALSVGSYLIIWGTFVFGAVMIAKAFILFRK